MAVLLTFKSNSYAQFIAVLLIFVVVLAVTALTTRYIANYQKQQGSMGNIELLESANLGSNKYIQIIRVANTYLAVAVCKDSVTKLCEIPAEQLKEKGDNPKITFKELLEKASGKDRTDLKEPKE